MDKSFEEFLKRFSQSINEASKSIETYAQVVKQVNREFDEKPFNKWKEALEKYGRLTTEQGNRSFKILEQSIEAYKRNVRYANEITNKQKNVDQRLKDLKANIEKAIMEGSPSFSKYIEEQKKAILEQQQLQYELKKTEDSLQEFDSEFNKLVQQIVNDRKTIATHMKDSALSFIKQKIAAASLTAGLQALEKQTRETISGARGFVEGGGVIGLFKNFGQALFRALSPQDLAEIMSMNRQAVLAMGGQTKTLEILDTKINETGSVLDNYRVALGDATLANKAAVEQLTIMGKAGIKPSAHTLANFAMNIKDMSKMTGMSITEWNSQLASLFNEDVEMQHILRSVREQEREAIVQNTTAMIKQNVALGMTSQQAIEAAKMLSRMVAVKPLERIKQAARLRALSGALGIAGGEEAAQALLRGGRTPEDRAALMKFSQAAATQVDTMRGMGLAQEIFATQLLEKLDFEQYLGKGSPFSTAMAKALEPQEKAVGELTHVNNNLMKLLQYVETIKNGIQTLTPILTIIGGMMGIKAIRSFFGRERLTEMGKEAVEIAKQGATTAEKSIGKSAGKFAGKSLIKKIPILGLIAGTGLAAQRFFEGDKTGALMELASGAAGTVPGIGTAASVGIDAALLARDIKKNNQKIATDITESQEESASLFKQQLDKIEETNSILMKIANNTEKQLLLNEKQLSMLAMSDEERKALVNLNADERIRRIQATSSQYRTLAQL